MEKITSFTDLHAWRMGHQFVLAVYKITRQFPPEERFALASQLQRAVVGVTSNVDEGFSRMSKREKEQFYSIALESLTETQNQLLIARDLGYIRK